MAEGKLYSEGGVVARRPEFRIRPRPPALWAGPGAGRGSTSGRELELECGWRLGVQCGPRVTAYSLYTACDPSIAFAACDPSIAFGLRVGCPVLL